MYIIGIAGGSGSGKTTFTQKVLAQVNDPRVGVMHQDNYYLSQPPRELLVDGEPNFDHPDAFDWPLLRNHLGLLKESKRVEMPIYDYESEMRTKEVQVLGPCKILILEGIFALWDRDLREQMDLKFYLHVESDIRFIRRLFRDLKDRARTLEEVIRQYYDLVRPMPRNAPSAT